MAKKHLSVVKRARQNRQRNARNSQLRSSLRTAIKKVAVAVESGDIDTAREQLPHAVRALGKAKSKGVIHRNQAGRRISRLTRHVNALLSSQS